jgi:hypothetical protein
MNWLRNVCTGMGALVLLTMAVWFVVWLIFGLLLPWFDKRMKR